MAVVAMKQLLEAGVHFGHQTRRWDPKMAEYIFQARNGIHIIDLQKTSKKLDEAYAFLKEQAEAGKTVLFVGTKKQAQECVKEAAEKCGMYYVNQRWLGGMLTNFNIEHTAFFCSFLNALLCLFFCSYEKYCFSFFCLTSNKFVSLI